MTDVESRMQQVASKEREVVEVRGWGAIDIFRFKVCVCGGGGVKTRTVIMSSYFIVLIMS